MLEIWNYTVSLHNYVLGTIVISSCKIKQTTNVVVT